MKTCGVTLIEIMVVVIIIGILFTFLSPKIIGLIDKSKEAQIKGLLATYRSVLRIYYSDNQTFPQTPTGQDITDQFINNVLIPKYLGKTNALCDIQIPKFHNRVVGFFSYSTSPLIAEDVLMDGEFAFGYCGDVNCVDFGNIFVNCSHQDSKGIYYFKY